MDYNREAILATEPRRVQLFFQPVEFNFQLTDLLIKLRPEFFVPARITRLVLRE
jgi:hypothetical protein